MEKPPRRGKAGVPTVPRGAACFSPGRRMWGPGPPATSPAAPPGRAGAGDDPLRSRACGARRAVSSAQFNPARDSGDQIARRRAADVPRGVGMSRLVPGLLVPGVSPSNILSGAQRGGGGLAKRGRRGRRRTVRKGAFGRPTSVAGAAPQTRLRRATSPRAGRMGTLRSYAGQPAGRAGLVKDRAPRGRSAAGLRPVLEQPGSPGDHLGKR